MITLQTKCIRIETKKRKLLNDSEQSTRKMMNTNLENALSLEILLTLFPVLADKYSQPTDTEKMFVGKICLKKETSRLIKELSTVWPLKNKSHLKRVRWTPNKDIFEIIIRPVKENEDSSTLEVFPLARVMEHIKIDTTGLMDSVFICNVPKNAPLTSKQHKEASLFWPTQFRENKYIEKVLKDEIFSTEQKANIGMFMRKCICAAQYGDEKVGCVIVDPEKSKVVAISRDCRRNHPLQHAVMVAVDLVARSHGGGSWNIESEHLYHLPYSKEESEEKIKELKKLNPDKDVKKMALPYLCTGYDAYISREPCVMCAMSLVHSRIRRVFYASKIPWGALGSHCKLHLQEGLNHHYEVWQVVLDKCELAPYNGEDNLEMECNSNL